MLESLPDELLQRVIAMNFAPMADASPAGTHSDYPSLKRAAWTASMARVSRRWPRVVYPVLYRTVCLLTRSSAERFLRALERHPIALSRLHFGWRRACASGNPLGALRPAPEWTSGGSEQVSLRGASRGRGCG